MMEPIRLEFDERFLVAREIVADDLDAIVSYWHESPPEYLASIGVDVRKLGDREHTWRRFQAGLDREPPRHTLVVVAESGDRLVAYASFRVLAPDVGCGHVHALVRAKTTSAAIYRLFPEVLDRCFAELDVSRLVFETSPINFGVNRLLQTFGLVPQRTWLDAPDGMAGPGEFYVYEATRSAVRVP